MTVTIYSFIMSVLFSTVFLVAVHLFRNHSFFLRSFGVYTILALYALCFFRTVVIIELPFAVPVGLRFALSSVEAIREVRIPVVDHSVQLLDILCIIWGVVSLTLIVQFLWKNRRAYRKLARYAGNRSSVADEVFDRVKSESWRTPSVGLCVCPTQTVPAGIGLFHKLICLPDVEYSSEELYYILKHEYTHFCNRDLTVKFLVRLFCCVFWWNPAVYLFKKDIDQILEIKCDIKATERFNKREKSEYLTTIVRLLEDTRDSNYKPPTMLATGMAFRTYKGNVKERFRLITEKPHPANRVFQGAFWAAIVLAVVLSYPFVLQTAFEAPVEEIYTDSTVQEFTTENAYILKQKDGSFILVLDSGEMVPMTQRAMEAYLSVGLEIKEEN